MRTVLSKWARNESGATLTLRLIFRDGTLAVARFAGATSDPNRRDQPVGTSTATVATADQLSLAGYPGKRDVVVEHGAILRGRRQCVPATLNLVTTRARP